MPTLRVETPIVAPALVCFDLARDMDVHARSAAATGERIVSGHGRLALGDEVTFEATHLGIRQRFTARITRYEPPRLFEDRMIRGAFRSFVHQHEFLPVGKDGSVTLMVDTVTYEAPLGILGRAAEVLVLSRYLRRFLARRGQFLKEVASELSDEGAFRVTW